MRHLTLHAKVIFHLLLDFLLRQLCPEFLVFLQLEAHFLDELFLLDKSTFTLLKQGLAFFEVLLHLHLDHF